MMKFTRIFGLFTFTLVFCYFGDCHARALPYLAEGDSGGELEAHFINPAISSSASAVIYTSTFQTLSHKSARTPITPQPSSHSAYHLVQATRQASETLTLSPSSILYSGFSPSRLKARDPDPGWQSPQPWQPRTPIPVPLIIVLIMFTPLVCFVILHHIHTVFQRYQTRKAGTTRQLQPSMDKTEIKTCERVDFVGNATTNCIVPLMSSSRVNGFSPKVYSDDDTLTCTSSSSSGSSSSFCSRLGRPPHSSKADVHFNEPMPNPLPRVPPRVAYTRSSLTKFDGFEHFPNGKEYSGEWVVSRLLIPNGKVTVGNLPSLEAQHINVGYI